MIRLVPWLCVGLVAACDPDIVAIQSGADGGLPLYCLGDGPPILVGDGITVGEGNGSNDDVCSGEIAVRTFRNALCTCEDYVTSTPLTTDSFDGAIGPYEPGGTDGPVGIDGLLQTSAVLTIGGGFVVGTGASMGADLDVAGDAAIGGDLGVGVDVTVAGDAQVAGDIDLGSLSVGGVLTVPSGNTISAGTTAGSTVRAPVTVEPPCACEPDDLVDIADFVASSRDDNENALIGLAPDSLTDYTGDVTLELPCGRYHLGPVRGGGSLTLRATGRVAVLIDGDLAMTAPLAIELATPDAEIDILIAGLLSSDASIVAGDPARPSRTRLYVGGGGDLEISGDSQLAANLYAPRAALILSGTSIVHGSLFVRRLVQAAPVDIHYDVDVLRADSGC